MPGSNAPLGSAARLGLGPLPVRFQRVNSAGMSAAWPGGRDGNRSSGGRLAWVEVRGEQSSGVVPQCNIGKFD